MKNRVLPIPAPTDGRRFTAYHGRELIAMWEPTEPDTLILKTESCNYCGMCCHDYPNTPFGVDPEGRCNKLVRNGEAWECSAAGKVPFDCLGDPIADIPECSIRYKKVKVK